MGSPSPTRILLVDDDQEDRTRLRLTLEQLGYDIVAESASGPAGVDLARKTRPDLVMLSLALEDEPLSAARLILDEDIAPVVAMTADGTKRIVDEATSAGIAGVLAKPIREIDLIPGIETALAHYARVRELGEIVRDLEDQLETRKLVERAKGVLMETQGLKEAEAFQRMRRTSMDSRKSMREVAEAILLSHQLQSGSD
jgi:response regulator NasT